VTCRRSPTDSGAGTAIVAVPRKTAERLEQRMIAAAPIVLEATAEALDDAGELPDGDVEDSPPDAPA